MNNAKSILQSIFILFLISCTSTTEPEKEIFSVNGTVRSNLENNSPIYPAYLFLDDKHISVTDEEGKFTITHTEGTHNITCSALYYRDTIWTINSNEGGTNDLNIILTPDSTLGLVVGEFQDLFLFNEKSDDRGELNYWTAQQICDGNTGATIQLKTLRYDVPPQYVYLDDSLLAVTDYYGQYLFEIQYGTYQFRGTCDPYIDSTQVIKVLPNTNNYMNFFLARKPE